jgi:ABC-2 type transport system permease protein
MGKLIAVIKREYIQRIKSRMFIVITLLGPLMLVLFSLVPALIFNIKTGGPVRIAVVDQTGRLYDRVRDSLAKDDADAAGLIQSRESSISSNANPATIDRLQAIKAATKISFVTERASPGKDLVVTEAELNDRLAHNQLDGYVILPPDILEAGVARFYTKNLSDVFTRETLQERMSRAVIEQRMIDANIAPDVVRQKNEPIKLRTQKSGQEGKEDSGSNFAAVFITGFLVYITILMYGQTILGAVVEEKETRIAEMLFSSVDSFTLMLGKLIGVSLVALTQLGIWGMALVGFALYGVGMLAAAGMPVALPQIGVATVIWFALFFLLGYFLYATIYALVGSMVTTTQEGGQLAVGIVVLLVIGFYLAFPVIRSPDSPFAFWVSMVPFFSPITMTVRIVTQSPPVWQILLALLIGFATVILLMWLAARIYRIGMLMHGKKATIPEVLRWVRQP